MIYFFQANQAAFFYKKNASKKFKSNLFICLGLLMSCEKIKMKGNGKLTIEYWPQKMYRIDR